MAKEITQEKIDRLLEIETAYKSAPELKRSQRKTAKDLGISRGKLANSLLRLANLRSENPNDQRLINKDLMEGTITPKEAEKFELPKTNKIKKYLFTSAQNNTKIHKEFWNNLKAYASHLGAELVVGTFTYSHNNNSEFTVKRGTNKENHSLWWAKELEEHGFVDERMEIAPDLIWCGDWNILPTVTDPVVGLDSYGGLVSNIFPHTKVRQKSIPVQKGTTVKRNMTTGTVTQINYVQRKAGMKAEFDHVFGATYVEVDCDGNWFHRQIIADSEDGCFFDLEKWICDGVVSVVEDLEYAIVHGDIHAEQFNYRLAGPVWQNEDSVINTLPIRRQVFHDLLDFKSQNRHEQTNFFSKFKNYINDKSNVEEEILRTASLLYKMTVDGVENIISYSNHDDMLIRWLNDPNNDFRKDPENALFFLRMSYLQLLAIQSDTADFSIFEAAIHEALNGVYTDEDGNRVKGLTYFCKNVDESIIHNGIEIAKHGHVGVKGSKGSLKQFANFGQKAIVGHYHESGIDRGATSVGVYGNLEMGYNKGLGSWTHTFALIYPNGKRTLNDIKEVNGEMRWRLE